MRQTVLFVDDNPVILKTIELAFVRLVMAMRNAFQYHEAMA